MTDATSSIDTDRLDIATKPDIDIAAKFFRGLADPTRLRIVTILLREGEMRVGDLVDAVDGLQGRVSSHLACLRHCGLVSDRKEGRNVYYSAPDPRVREFLPVALSMIADNATHIATCHRIES
ncbi:MAG: metalloregulator ArsR/SmtB family transcription factor [Actinobacteria bacterium]|nr:metalloregulator ArsR/SmtB family transcription factor [Actinomycetota bacterium]MBW3614725.1 metalloregulator ArsR/SmtB family transcription factor [Actinomycetota bacterium]